MNNGKEEYAEKKASERVQEAEAWREIQDRQSEVLPQKDGQANQVMTMRPRRRSQWAARQLLESLKGLKMSFGLRAKSSSTRAIKATKKILRLLRRKKHMVIIDEDLAETLGEDGTSLDDARFDMLVTVLGDGSSAWQGARDNQWEAESSETTQLAEGPREREGDEDRTLKEP